MKLQSFRPSPSMAVSLLALVIALGTAGYAADTVFSTDIVDGEVKTADIANFGVTGADLAPNAVRSSNVFPNSLTAADLKGADVSGTITLTAGSVPQNRCINASTSVAGAQVGEVPIIALKGNIVPGMLIYAVRVAVANQVLLKICNLTGGSSPAISNVPVRMMTFG